MNWGHKITLSFIAFAAFIIYMVVGAFRQNVDLVTDDYYAQEIAYEAKMIKKANFNKLESKPKVVANKGGISLDFFENKVENGSVYFYHPSREIFDQTIDLKLDDKGRQNIPRGNLVAGLYRINLQWTSDGKEYFHQETIFIQ